MQGEGARRWPAQPASVEAIALRFETGPAKDAVSYAIHEAFAGSIALVSSFGAASVVLLHMVARTDSAIPVLFLDTGMHFPETIAYRDRLRDRLGLVNVRVLRPHVDDLLKWDPEGDLHGFDSPACCRIRKVEPLERALEPFEAWITGRRQNQTAGRRGLAVAEIDQAGRTKLNPLARWTGSDVAEYMARHDLPEHPLVARRYPSIGCAPCTTPVMAGEDERAGRWRGEGRDECGIHFVNGSLMRTGRGRRGPMDEI